jgi:hypothetical protein
LHQQAQGGANAPTAHASVAAPTAASVARVFSEARSKFGLDLSDPIVQEELLRMQEEHRRTGKIGVGEEELRQTEEMVTKFRETQLAEKTSERAASSSQGWIVPTLGCVLLALVLRWLLRL